MSKKMKKGKKASFIPKEQEAPLPPIAKESPPLEEAAAAQPDAIQPVSVKPPAEPLPSIKPKKSKSKSTKERIAPSALLQAAETANELQENYAQADDSANAEIAKPSILRKKKHEEKPKSKLAESATNAKYFQDNVLPELIEIAKPHEPMEMKAVQLAGPLGYEDLFEKFGTKTHYPFQIVKEIYQGERQLISSLDLSGVDQLTDYFFYLLMDAPADNLAVTTSISCVGCIHITDNAVRWMSRAFTELLNVSLVGCTGITERSIYYFIEGCKKLKELDMSGTAVSKLPNDTPFQIACSGCPIFGKDPANKLQPVNTYKVVIADTGSLEAKLLPYLVNENPTTANSQPVHFKARFTIEDNSYNIYESSQGCLDFFIGNRSICVLPFNASNKEDIEKRNLVERFFQILVKEPTAAFAFVGIIGKKDVQETTSEDMKIEIKNAVKIFRAQLEEELSKAKRNLISLDYGAQRYFSHAAFLLDVLADFDQHHVYFDAGDLNFSLAGNSLRKAVAKARITLDKLNPSQVTFSEEFVQLPSTVDSLFNFCITEKDLIKKLRGDDGEEAGKLLADQHMYTRALSCLHDLGVLMYWPSDSGRIVMKGNFFALCVNTVLTGTEMSEKLQCVVKDTPIWSSKSWDTLLKSLSGAVDSDLLNKAASLVLQSSFLVQPSAFLYLDKKHTEEQPVIPLLKDTPPIDLGHYSLVMSNQEYSVGHVYTFLHPVSQSFFCRIFSRICKLWSPELLWSSGVLIQYGTVDVLILRSEASDRLEVRGQGSVEEAMTFTVELCKMLIDFTLNETGICYSFQITGEKEKGKKLALPGAIPHHSRAVTSNTAVCGHCGIKADVLHSLWSMYSSLHPCFALQVRGFGKSDQLMTNKGNIYTQQSSEAVLQLSALSTMDFSYFEIMITKDLSSFQIGVENSGPYCQVVINVYTGQYMVFESGGTKKLPRRPVIGDCFRVVMQEKTLTDYHLSVYCNEALWFHADLPAKRGNYYPYMKALGRSGNFILNCCQMPIWEPTQHSLWKVGMKLEAKDLLNPSLICVATVDDVRPGEVLIHFDGWTRKYDYWSSTTAVDLHPLGYCAHKGFQLQKPKSYRGSFTWIKYLAETKTSPVPYDFFSVDQTDGTPQTEYEKLNKNSQPAEKQVNKGWEVDMRLEAKDLKNPSLICVAAIEDVDSAKGEVLISFDGYGNAYDYWSKPTAADLHPIGYCEHKGIQLQPPLGYHSKFTWDKYLQEVNSAPVPYKLFNEAQKEGTPKSNVYAAYKPAPKVKEQKLWKVGLKLEAVDIQNPKLICVATVDGVQADKVLIHFDGWGNNYDYWSITTDSTLRPVGYCAHKKLVLQKPKGYGKDFSWNAYLKETNSEPAPHSLFNEDQSEGTPEYMLTDKNESEETEALGCLMLNDRVSVWEKSIENHMEQLVDIHSRNGNRHWLTLLPSGHLMKNDFITYPQRSAVASFRNHAVYFVCPVDSHFVNYAGHSKKNDTLLSEENRQALYMAFLQTLVLLKQEVIIPTAYNNMLPKLEDLSIEKIEKGIRKILWMSVLELYKILELDFTTDHGFSEYASRLNQSDQEQQIAELWQQASVTNVDLKNAMAALDEKSSDSSRHRFVCSAHKMLQTFQISRQKQLLKSAVFPTHVFRFYSIFITHFTMSDLGIPRLPEDFFKMFPRLVHMDVSSNGMKYFPASGLEMCKHLAYLNVSFNQLPSLPSDLVCLADSLQELHISRNPLQEIPAFVFEMSKLRVLKAEDLPISALPESISQLVSLEELNLGGHMIKKLPDSFGKLQKLKVLNLSGVKWLSSDITALITKDFFIDYMNSHPESSKKSFQEKNDLFNSCLEGQKDVLSTEEREKLNLSLFNMFHRFMAESPEDPTGGFPSQVFELTGLKKFEFRYQGIIKVPSQMMALTELEHVDFSHNPLLITLPAELGNLPIADIHLKGCPSMKTPPKEIIASGVKSILSYLKRLIQGAVECRRTKLMFVGLGGAGKTSLSRGLMNRGRAYSNTKAEKITDGIDVTEWKVNVSKYTADSDNTFDPYDDNDDLSDEDDEDDEEDNPDTNKDIVYSVWDFAGQTVYYNTHQFFLSNRAVYMLLWNMRLGYEHAGLDFWLGSIACHAPKAPVLIVGSHKDQVEKFELPMVEMKARFPQIAGFFFVSSYTGEGINNLARSLIKITLKEKYMGERIPEAWLMLEKSILNERKTHSLLPFEKIKSLSLENGISSKAETGQAVQFLHNLGTLQYFQNDFLKDRVCINPQWIIDVMKCIVSVHKNPIDNGKLKHTDLSKIWHGYESNLYPWLLRLTEEFDLSFSVPEEKASLVPCMLPEKQPEFEWPNVSERSGARETRMMYKFEYLPAGLFNRAQARLYQVSDMALVWKKGSYMSKNGNKALVTANRDNQISVKVQGPRPENILFVIHEIIEGLITESFFGVSYDYFIPCSDCIRIGTYDPCMFSGAKIRRATEMKASFLQCDKYFHILSLTELHAIKPPDTGADFDVHLERTMQDLNNLKEDISTDIFMFYSGNDVPRPGEEDVKVHPEQIRDDLTEAGFSVWFPNDPANVNVDQIALEMKVAKLIVVCMSNHFVNDQKCCHVFHFAKTVLQKNIQLVVLSSSRDWLKSDIGILVASDVFVNMNHQSRYQNKIKELTETVGKKLGRDGQGEDEQEFPECFISYCWSNSHAAIKAGSKEMEGALGWADPRSFKAYLEEHKIRCWMDIERVGQTSGLFEDIAKGLRHAKVVVACVADEYAKSKNCLMELRFALTSLNIPVILAVVGTGYQWEASEVGMLSLGCAKINFQIENHSGYEQLLNAVKERLPETEKAPENVPKVKADDKQVAFQELLELAQRKFLRQLIAHSDNTETSPYPRLLITDYLTKDEKQAILDAEREEQERRRREQDDELKELAKLDKSDECESETANENEKQDENDVTTEGTNPSTENNNSNNEKEEAGENTIAGESANGHKDPASENDNDEKTDTASNDNQTLVPERSRPVLIRRPTAFFQTGPRDVSEDWPCFRILCEHEQGWHTCGQPLPVKIAQDKILSMAPYLARMNSILKHNNTDLPLVSSDVGRHLIKLLEEHCGTSNDFKEEYLQLRSAVIEADVNSLQGDLARCHLPSGKTLWLCKEHQESYGRITLLTIDMADTTHTDTQEDKLLATHLLEQSLKSRPNRPKTGRREGRTEKQRKTEARGKLIGAGTAAGGAGMYEKKKASVADSYAAANKNSRACRLM